MLNFPYILEQVIFILSIGNICTYAQFVYKLFITIG